MHEQLLGALESVADVKLVCRLKDPRLGFANPKDMRIFIPDLHLISDQRLQEGQFRFHTNCEPLLINVLGALKVFQGQVDADQDVAVTHLGDILDLWRETGGLDPSRDIPARIANDHAELINALRNPGFGATIFLGNHDYELHLWASYASCVRKLFIPEGAPQVVVLHGDVFDWVERLPEETKNFLVFYFSPDVEPNDYQLGQMYSFVQRTIPDAANQQYIRCPAPVPLGNLQSTSELNVPDYFNVQKKGSAEVVHEFLDLAYEQAQQANEQHGLNLKTVIIGHTHHARIAVREDNGDLFTLIDCGAWIENCSVDGSSDNVMPNAQIAALCGNEARIYQLLAKAPTVPDAIA
jgi:UDP-2,3-diacylglucosamine pyrophosphatase LpxH